MDQDIPTTPQRRRPGQRPTPAEKRQAQDAFLAEFAQKGIVRDAAKVAGVERRSIYRWRERDAAFSALYDQAEQDANDALRAEIFHRAVEGVDKPVVSMGRVVTNPDGTPMLMRERSDRLLEFLARARMPEFREKVQVEQSGRTIVQHEYPDDPEAAAIARALLARVAGGSSADAGRAGVPGE